MKNKIEALQLKAAELTRETHALGIPVMIVFEGVPASGKTRLTNDLLLTLDAKYTQFIATKTPSEHDLRFQFLQNFWNTLPAKGHINIYFRSWYAHYIDYKIHEIKKSTFKDYDKLKNEIYEFETMLRNDNHEIIKFYIQINEEKRQEHIAQMKDNPLTHWKAQEYEQVIPTVTYQEEFQHLLDKEWEVIDYTRREHAIQQMYEHLIERLEKAIKHYHQRE
ncbi:MAG: phosphate--AMP phosphotransferase, partial [Staphylococcus chromogenes]|nr:phosphate--AMP phosphotransferase [Staphylococcus chromogenes]